MPPCLARDDYIWLVTIYWVAEWRPWLRIVCRTKDNVVNDSFIESSTELFVVVTVLALYFVIDRKMRGCGCFHLHNQAKRQPWICIMFVLNRKLPARKNLDNLILFWTQDHKIVKTLRLSSRQDCCSFRVPTCRFLTSLSLGPASVNQCKSCDRPPISMGTFQLNHKICS